MLKGRGTDASPLHAAPIEIMDIDHMVDTDSRKPAYIMIVRNRQNDELYALSISVENFAEFLEKGAEVHGDI